MQKYNSKILSIQYISIMKRILLTFSFLVALVVTSFAQQVSVADATQRARAFWSNPSSPARNHRVMASAQPKLAYTAQKGSAVYFYVFNNAGGEGFVIVGGDETAKQILGYSFSGTFDYATMPANVKWWLSQYENDIRQGIANANASAQKKAPANNTKADVADLILTKWNQNSPFNNAIPNLEGAKGDDRFATGCVATAMAQIMKKHEWPDSIGTGTNSYQQIYNANDTIVFSANFARTHFAWDKMKNSYNGSYTDEEADAVAKLMYAAGVSVNMNYGTISSGGSSAYNESVGLALINHFGYDKGAVFNSRDMFADDAWEDLIYNELIAGRPVLYGGQTVRNEGHAFVIHGYSAIDNTFSVNWGWGGLYDGYFTLRGTNALRPSNSGIGGGSAGYGYTVDQSAMTGIRPDVGNDYVWQMSTLDPYQMYDKDNKLVESVSVNKKMGDENVRMSIKAFNQSLLPNSFSLGLLLVDENTHQSKVIENITTLNNVPYNSGTRYGHVFNTEILPYDGVYSVYPIFRLASSNSASDWKRIAYPASMKVPTITISGGSKPEPIPVDFKISATAMKEETSVKITYNSNYTGKITCTVDTADRVAITQSTGVITVTGKRPGIVHVTVNAEAAGYYKATERTFELTVTEVPVVPVEIKISGTEVTVGEKLTITHDPAYEGKMLYSCDTLGIVGIDSLGVVTGLAPGRVRITATAEGSRFYTRTTEYFDVTVSSEPKGLYLLEASVSQNGCFTEDSLTVRVKLKNNTGKTLMNETVMCTLKAGLMQFNNSGIFTGYPQGSILTYSFQFPKYILDYFTKMNAIGETDYLVELNQGILTELAPGQYSVAIGDRLEPTEKSSFHITLCEKATVKTTLKQDEWNTIVLPFDAALPSGVKLYQCSEYEEGYIKTEEVKTNMIKMFTPYLIKGKAGNYTFVGPDIPNQLENYSSGILTGTTKKNDVPAGSYVLGTRDDVMAFYKVNADETVKNDAYKAYLTLPVEGNTNDAFYFSKEDYRKYGKLPDLTVYADIAANGWGTIMFPFDVALPDTIKAYECAEHEDAYIVLKEVTDSLLAKNTPYVINGTPGEYVFTGPQDREELKKTYTSGLLVANTVNDTIRTDAYIIETRDSLTALYRITAEDSIAIEAFNAYFVIPMKEGVDEPVNMYYLSEKDYNDHNKQPEPEPFLGDANDDGTISVADLSLIASYILGSDVEMNKVNADVNGDGDISVADLSAIASMILSN